MKEGINMRVSADNFVEYDFRRLVDGAVEGDSMLTISDSNTLDEYSIKRISKNGKEHVNFA